MKIDHIVTISETVEIAIVVHGGEVRKTKSDGWILTIPDDCDISFVLDSYICVNLRDIMLHISLYSIDRHIDQGNESYFLGAIALVNNSHKCGNYDRDECYNVRDQWEK